MNWPTSFASRLSSWSRLREQCADVSAPSALTLVNRWWFHTPWRPYYLHWDDQDTWPDPWQLLSDNIYCDLARGLGILYTLSLIEHVNIPPAQLVLTKSGHNLVLVDDSKYILNWEPDTVVNNNLEFQIHRQYQQTLIA